MCRLVLSTWQIFLHQRKRIWTLYVDGGFVAKTIKSSLKLIQIYKSTQARTRVTQLMLNNSLCLFYKYQIELIYLYTPLEADHWQFFWKKWKFLAIFFEKMSSFWQFFDSQIAIFRRVRLWHILTSSTPWLWRDSRHWPVAHRRPRRSYVTLDTWAPLGNFPHRRVEQPQSHKRKNQIVYFISIMKDMHD